MRPAKVTDKKFGELRDANHDFCRVQMRVHDFFLMNSLYYFNLHNKIKTKFFNNNSSIVKKTNRIPILQMVFTEKSKSHNLYKSFSDGPKGSANVRLNSSGVMF